MLTTNHHQPWNSSLPTLIHLPNCKTQLDINQIHARLLTTGFIKSPYLTTKLILCFSSSPHIPLIRFARHIFFSNSIRLTARTADDPFLWNAVIKTFSHGNCPKEAVLVLGLMIENGVCVDKFTVSLVLKACSRMGLVREGVQVHGFMEKVGFGGDLYLGNCLICMYVKFGCVEVARQVFDKMPQRDLVSFNAMIDGYVKCGMVGLGRELFDSLPVEMRSLRARNCLISGYGVKEGGFEMAWKVFDEMPERDVVSWNSMIRCCVKNRKMELARLLFDEMPKRDVVTWAELIDGYAKSGEVGIARKLFDEMPERDVVSCNVMMAGYVQNGCFSEALRIFRKMTSGDGNLAPDDTTLSIALSAIAQLGKSDEGVVIHSYITENGYKLDGKLGVSLIDMYAKSGRIETATQVFDGIKEKTVDHWNAMIGGFAIHGFGKRAFDSFLMMRKLRIKPDGITFVNVLNACAHSGMVKEGVICFEIMQRVELIEPEIRHFGCLVDVFARAGRIEEAMAVIEEMPIEPNDVVFRTLLSACNIHLENGIQNSTVDSEIGMDGYGSSSSYVLLSNIYARFGMWDRVRRVRGMMKERKLEKVPGRSWIELDGTFHGFFVGDGSHPRVAEIYSVLDNWSSLDLRVESFGLRSKLEPALFPVGR